MINEIIYIGKSKVTIFLLALYACTINHNTQMRSDVPKKTIEADTTHYKKIDSSLLQMKKNLQVAKKCVNELKKEVNK